MWLFFVVSCASSRKNLSSPLSASQSSVLGRPAAPTFNLPSLPSYHLTHSYLRAFNLPTFNLPLTTFSLKLIKNIEQDE